ncbi:hypothetical protein [Okeania sp. SIO1I7]|uniref:hypothetical protein n=1 Tax=Okeania sp. SIO1I7 TaxID=2607772 RepID=UPI0013FAA07B|nr:hypothetical protein [Okeania sp. SIO1I7]NET27016.1 hypothetical protein [Okeania sp. SIO1I7]
MKKKLIILLKNISLIAEQRKQKPTAQKESQRWLDSLIKTESIIPSDLQVWVNIAYFSRQRLLNIARKAL